MKRYTYYKEEFNLDAVEGWLENLMEHPVFAVILGRHTGIHPGKYREDTSTTILIDEYEDLNDLKEQILDFLPESVYYDRNIYDKEGVVLGQEIAFDLILILKIQKCLEWRGQ